ncbi:hypothetical protein DPEC_G00301380 [Dallia pectoralis]|uniref:Uncharacterized protein n=1 Tax=Dallia pectoralis TaxID=75939 RepID=A0ACC2FGP4_DALPE|nr:hypothetical protein DPEC_G00301380 [Dallia pectoralis]
MSCDSRHIILMAPINQCGLNALHISLSSSHNCTSWIFSVASLSVMSLLELLIPSPRHPLLPPPSTSLSFCPSAFAHQTRRNGRAFATVKLSNCRTNAKPAT